VLSRRSPDQHRFDVSKRPAPRTTGPGSTHTSRGAARLTTTDPDSHTDTDTDTDTYTDTDRPGPARARRRSPAAVTVLATLLLVALIALGATGLGFATGWTKAAGGEVVVVRNGGFLDDNSFRQVIQPNSELTYTGLWSIDHPYPSSQRYFKVSAAQGADSNEVINVPTKDGVLVGVEDTFYFQLSTDPAILEDFDNKFGTRSFPAGNDSFACLGR